MKLIFGLNMMYCYYEEELRSNSYDWNFGLDRLLHSISLRW